MLTHVHTSSTLCGYYVGSKSEAVTDLEKEKEGLHPDRTLASARPDAGPCVQSIIAWRGSVGRGGRGVTGCCLLLVQSLFAIVARWRDQTRRVRVRSAMTYGDVSLGRVQERSYASTGHRGCQVNCDRTHPVTVFPL
jgi:hypothetical protein